MASLLSSTTLVEHAANDDTETTPSHTAGSSRVRLAERIAAIKPARSKLAQNVSEAIVEVVVPAVVAGAPAVGSGVPYRITEALSLEELMRKPEPKPAESLEDELASNPDARSGSEANAAVDATNRAGPIVSEVPSLSAETRLSELILEQRALIEDLARFSQRVAAVTSAASGKALTGPALNQSSEANELLDVVSEAVASYPAAEPATASAPPSPPSAAEAGSRSADEMIRALAAVVESRPEDHRHTVTAALAIANSSGALTALPIAEAYPQEASNNASDWQRSAGPQTQLLVHAPEPLTVASLIDEGRPPMIIERAYTSLPEHELGRELPRAPGFLAGLALSGAAGLALFFALRIA